MAYIFFTALIGGLLMYLLATDQSKAAKIAEVGRLVFFAAAIAFLVAIAPAAVHLLHGG